MFISLGGYIFFVERAVVADIDGTLVDNSKRLAYVLSKAPMGSPDFWRMFLSGRLFHMDEPLPKARECLNEMAKSSKIIYLSGRRAGTEEDTRKQLELGGLPAGEIFHRRSGKTLDFKRDKLLELRKRYDIVCAIGDSDEDMEAYREAGVRRVVKTETNKDWTECPCDRG